MKFKFENLDSIRTIAFLSTFMAHAFYTESESVKSSASFNFATQFQEIFSFGVPIFFVLSGFLISYLMLKEQEEVGKFNVKNFYIRRVLRIWPVYFLVLFIGFVLFPIVRDVVLHEPYSETANPIYYLLFLSNFDQIANTTLPYGVGLGPTWSVSIEEQFYLIWPLFLMVFQRKKFIYAILFVLLTSISFTLILGLANKHTVFCMTYLSIGGFFGYSSFYYKEFVLRATQFSSWVFYSVVALLLGFMYLSSIGQGGFYLIILIALTIGYLITYQCFSGKAQLKNIPFLERIGKYTYGLYLYHVICNFISHTLIIDILKIPDNNISVLLVVPIISLTISIAMSIISYNYFEKYFLMLKLKYSSLN
jgi:peptidoglycan/LPS O-acetylase OafA/YrhL